MPTTDYQIEKQQEEMDRVQAKLNIRTLTDFIYHVIKDKDQAHEVDQKIRNLVTPYLSDKEDIRNALYGEGKEI